MPDPKSIVELLTGLATLLTAIIAAYKATRAKNSSDETKEKLVEIQSNIHLLLNQTQAISQNLTHIQQTQVNVYTAGETRASAGSGATYVPPAEAAQGGEQGPKLQT